MGEADLAAFSLHAAISPKYTHSTDCRKFVGQMTSGSSDPRRSHRTKRGSGTPAATDAGFIGKRQPTGVSVAGTFRPLCSQICSNRFKLIVQPAACGESHNGRIGNGDRDDVGGSLMYSAPRSHVSPIKNA